MNTGALLVGEKEGSFIDSRWNFRILDNHISAEDRLACSLHYHSFFEIEIPYAGTATHLLNGELYRIQPGAVSLLRYVDSHRYECAPGEGVRIYNLIFNHVALPEELLYLLTSDSQNLSCHFEEDEFEVLLSDIRFLMAQQRKSNMSTVDVYMMRTVFTKVVLTILKKCPVKNKQPAENTEVPFYAALHRLQCRFRENITLQELAKEVGVTPNYLGQLFRSHLGIGFSEYIRKIRLEYARNLLHFYDYSIEQVAAFSGFATDSHFISCFKAVYGMTPKQYKAKKHLPSEEAL